MNKKSENKTIINKTLKTLATGIEALRVSTKILEEFESGKAVTKDYDKLEEFMFKVHNMSGDFVKNWNNVDMLASIMLITKELTESEYKKYKDRLLALKSEYEGFKEGRSESLRRLFV